LFQLAALNQLRNIFGLGKREAEAISIEITSKVYRKQLAQAAADGELEMADSKAAFLQNLCDQLHFDPQKASELHEGKTHHVCSYLEVDHIRDLDYLCSVNLYLCAILNLKIVICKLVM